MAAPGDHSTDVARDDEDDEDFSELPVFYNEPRHTEKIKGLEVVAHTWRMKERMKTVSVALVLCLNIGVDPPDVLKTNPCARMEAWIEPSAQQPQKTLEAIGAALQKQYERWQPRARYKQSLDPTVEDVKKLCTSLRRNAKEERVLFHYNGHGVPKPTANGEIWVFNKNYTQYIPLSMYDVQNWMSNPSIYVFDTSNAGILIESCLKFISQREKELKMSSSGGGEDGSNQGGASQVPGAGSIMLAACQPGQILPMNPDLPADLFTACLTTPVSMAMRWHVLVNSGKLVPGLRLEDLDKIPGSLNDRKSLLGELNWIFTAITDTIAWNMLPKDLFQRLFRQDLLVASLFRNYLLAERIMRSYNCTPMSSPMLPPTYQHSMWNAWDLTLDLCLKQINTWVPREDGKGENCPFFADQLKAFEVWLQNGSEKRNPPEQLPIVLQVLLSQIHRMCALDLLGRFLDLGAWAVSLALSVGIFPYVLKLLQSHAKELKPHLVFIWSKILAVDRSCQGDLVKDNGHKYFLSVMSDSSMSTWHRTMAAFITCIIMTDFRPGQEAALQGNVVSICLEQLDTQDRQYRHWLALCLGKVWTNFANARWCGVRDAGHEKLYPLLEDGSPEVRTAAVFALGTYISNCSERSDHANNIDLGVGMTLITLVNDGSPLVRQELAAALAGLVTQFQSQFQSVAAQLAEEERREKKAAAVITGETPGGWHLVGTVPTTSNATMIGSTAGSLESYESVLPSTQRMRRVASSSSVSALSGAPFSNVYLNVWNTLLTLAKDPHYLVALKAQTVVASIGVNYQGGSRNASSAISAPSSPSGSAYSRVGTPPTNKGTGAVAEEQRRRDHTSPTHQQHTRDHTSPTHQQQRRRDHTSPTHQRGGANNNAATAASSSSSSYSLTYSRRRKIFDKGPDTPDGQEAEQAGGSTMVGVATQFFQWSCNYFTQPKLRVPPERDPESMSYFRHNWYMRRNQSVIKQAKQTVLCSGINKLDDQLFVNKVNSTPTVVLFHPFEKFIAVNESHGVGFWDWELGGRINYIDNTLHVLPEKGAAITSMNFINAHSNSLLLCGTEDGAVRIWGGYLGDAKLITAFQALSDMQLVSKGAGLVTEFEQSTGTLYAAGDARYIRVWDAQTELKIRDIPTTAESCVTSLAIDSQGGSLVVAGCGDGTVRLFDKRMDPNDCRVTTLREHSSWVVNVHYQTGAVGKIISGSNCGEMRLWDPRFLESVNQFNLSSPLHAMSVHKSADIIACGCANQSISIHSMSGDTINTIKYHDGFLGQRIGNITCLNFHPYNVMLGAGSMDNTLSVFGNPAPKS